MNPNLVNFYNNWNKKAAGIDTASLAGLYDKYITLFVIYNNLYNQVPPHLTARGFVIPNKIYDSKAATEYVVSFLGGKNILDHLTASKNDSDISTIINLIDNEEFYIKIRKGVRQRAEDINLEEIFTGITTLELDLPSISQ
jgi:hypothetical protein